MAKIKRADVEAYDRIQHQISKLYEEMAALSKPKPDAPLNSFKLKVVNERLRAANLLLLPPHRPFDDFDEFTDESLPTNSDVVVVLSQYLDALEGWRSDHIVQISVNWFWDTEDRVNLPSKPPTRSKERK
jgi:hypothetical protein